MKAMFAPAVTMTRQPSATSIPFSSRSFLAIRATSDARPAPSPYSCTSVEARASRAAATACGGGP